MTFGKMSGKFHLLLRQSDKPFFWVLLSRLASIVLGAGTILLIQMKMSASEMAAYYVMTSLVGLHVFLELGSGWAVMHTIAHDRVGLKINAAKKQVSCIDGGALKHASALYAHLNVCCLFVLVGSILIISPIGSNVLRHGGYANSLFEWRLSAVAYATFTISSMVLQYLEGLGFIFEVSRLRFFSSTLGSIAACIGVALGFGTYAVALTFFAQAIVNLCGILCSFKWLLLELLRGIQFQLFKNVAKQILKFQLEVAVGWMASYVMMQSVSAVASLFISHREAAQFGLTQQVASIIYAIVWGYFSINFAKFGAFYSKYGQRGLDKCFWRNLRQSVQFSILLSSVACAGAFIGHSFFMMNFPYMGFLATAAALFTYCAFFVIQAVASYLRIMKNGKGYISLILGAVVTLLTGLLGFRFGVAFGVGLWMFLTLTVTLPFCFKVLASVRKTNGSCFSLIL